MTQEIDVIFLYQGREQTFPMAADQRFGEQGKVIPSGRLFVQGRGYGYGTYICGVHERPANDLLDKARAAKLPTISFVELQRASGDASALNPPGLGKGGFLGQSGPYGGCFHG